MKVGIIGTGTMAKVLNQVLQEETHQAGIFSTSDLLTASPLTFPEKPDVLIDFSHPNNLEKISHYALEEKIPVVFATTGYTENQLVKIRELGRRLPVLQSANFALGILVMKKVVQEITRILGADFDIEITEAHHHKKIDAPSGTAKLLASAIQDVREEPTTLVYGREGVAPREKNEIGIHALRGGTIFGEHEVLFAGPSEVLKIQHTAYGKDIFAKGALKAAHWLVRQAPNFYTMEDCLFGGK